MEGQHRHPHQAFYRQFPGTDWEPSLERDEGNAPSFLFASLSPTQCLHQLKRVHFRAPLGYCKCTLLEAPPHNSYSNSLVLWVSGCHQQRSGSTRAPSGSCAHLKIALHAGVCHCTFPLPLWLNSSFLSGMLCLCVWCVSEEAGGRS